MVKKKILALLISLSTLVLVSSATSLSSITLKDRQQNLRPLIMQETIHYSKVQLSLNDTILSEGFESGRIPAGWLNVDYDGDSMIWIIMSILDGYQAHTGNNSIASASYTFPSGPLTPDNWLITNKLDLKNYSRVQLSYWVAAQSPIRPYEHIEVWVSTMGTQVPDDFTDQVDNYTCVSDNWVNRSIDLSRYYNETIFLAFRHCHCTNQYWVKVDDILVTGSLGGPLEVDAGGPYEGAIGEEIQFIGTVYGGVPPYSYHWNFGDGNESYEQNPRYAYSEGGFYIATFTVTDNEENTSNDTATVSIEQPPPIPPTVEITQPEKGLYIANVKVRPYFLERKPLILGSISINVEATQEEVGINYVEFYIDNELKFTDDTAPYNWNWTWSKVAFFTHEIKAIAVDNNQNSESDQILVIKLF